MLRIPAGLVFAFLILRACESNSQPPPEPPQPDPSDPVVRLMVDFTGGSAEILRATRLGTDHVHQPKLPTLTTGAWKRPGRKSGEFVVATHDQAQKPTNAVAVNAHPLYFEDHFSGGRPRWSGPVRPGSDVRFVDIRIPAESRHLTFYRTGVGPQNHGFDAVLDEHEDHAFGLNVLKVYPLDPNSTPPANLDHPFTPGTGFSDNVNISPTVLDGFDGSDDDSGIDMWTVLLSELVAMGRPDVPPPAGHYVDSFFYPESEGDFANHFNMVFLAEGFTEQEFPVFESETKQLIDTILETPGLEEHKELINCLVVRAASNASSKESGMPPAVPKNVGDEVLPDGEETTYFRTRSSFPMDASWLEGLTPDQIASLYSSIRMGTKYPELYVNAADSAGIDEHHVGIYVLVTNQPEISGGYAWPNLNMAYVDIPLDNDAETFANTGVHEMAHVIGKLADEYSAQEPIKDMEEKYPNMVRRIGSGSSKEDFNPVPWLVMAEGEELSEDDWFSIIQTCEGDAAFDPSILHPQGVEICKQTIVDLPPPEGETIGLYWGCTYFGCCYFRPAPTCKMRTVSADFCRVCRKALGARITSVITP